MARRAGRQRWCADDGTWLDAEIRLAHTPESVGVVLLLHAMMADARAFDRPAGRGLAFELQQAGFDVVLANFRGRAGSGTPLDKGGRWTYDDLVRYDTPAFVRGARALAGEKPLALAGHSLGGHVAVASVAAGHTEVDALALLATNTWLRALEPSAWMRVKKTFASAALWSVGAFAGRLPGRALHVGPVDESGAYTRDIARTWLQNAWRSRDGTEDWFEAASRLRIPVSQWHASDDTFFAPLAGAAAWSWSFGAEQFVVGRGGCGVDAPLGHMAIATDERARPAWQRLAQWLRRATAKPAQQA